MDSREFFYRLGRIIYKIDNHYSDIAKSENVKQNLLWILYALNDGEKHTQKQISEEWDLPLTTINTIVKDLEKNCFVILEKIKGKKRELNIVLTERGKEFAQKALKDLYKKELQVFVEIKERAESLICDLENFESVLSRVFNYE